MTNWQRFHEVTLTEEQEARTEQGWIKLDGHEVYPLTQTDTEPTTWGYSSRQGELIACDCHSIGTRWDKLTEIASRYDCGIIPDDYAQNTVLRLPDNPQQKRRAIAALKRFN